MREKHLKNVGVFNHFIQAILFSSIFVFTSNVSGIRIILERSLQAILFPIAIVPDAIASLLAFFNFTKAKNKNLGKTVDLIYIPTKTAIVFTAVFAGLSIPVVHSLFLVAVSSGIFYHTFLTLYNAYHLWKTPKNSDSDLALRERYKANIIMNAIASTIGLIVLTGIVATLIFAPLLSAPLLTVAGIGTAVMLILATTYSVYQHFKQPVTLSVKANLSATDKLKTQATKNYYYCKLRSEQLNGNNFKADIEFLLEEYKNKDKELSEQIKLSEKKTSEFFWPERKKRNAKKHIVAKLADNLTGFDPSTDNRQFVNSMRETLSTAKPKVFQSFFRNISDTQDILDATQKFVELYQHYTGASQNAPQHETHHDRTSTAPHS